jgi:hypothetical protein
VAELESIRTATIQDRLASRNMLAVSVRRLFVVTVEAPVRGCVTRTSIDSVMEEIGN